MGHAMGNADTSSTENLSASQPVFTPPATARRLLRSSALFGPADEVIIEHHGAEYRLRITRQGKLILTK